MPAVLGRAQHLPEGRPLVVLGILHESGDGIVNTHEALAPRNEPEQRLPQLRIVEQHAHGIQETERVELLDLSGRNISMSLLKTAS